MTAAHPKPSRQALKMQTLQREQGIEQGEKAIERPGIRSVPLSAVVMSVEFHRLAIVLNDVIHGAIEEGDAIYEIKQKELEGIISLAHTLKLGLLNYPNAYALPGNRIAMIDGHRRFLAFVYRVLHIEDRQGYSVDECLELSSMEVRLYSQKPADDLLNDIAVVGNTHQEKLQLDRLLEWALRRNEIEFTISGKTLDSPFYVETFNIAKSQAAVYQKIIKLGREDLEPVISALREGKLKNLTQVHRIANEPVKRKRQQLMDRLQRAKTDNIRKKNSNINLGTMVNSNGVKVLIEKALGDEYKTVIDAGTDWNSAKEVQKTFRVFIKHWELKYVD